MKTVQSMMSKLAGFMHKLAPYKLLFGEVLVKEKIINEEQLQKALELQSEKFQQVGKVIRIGQIIVDIGFATEEQVVSAVNNHFKIKAQTLSDNIEDLINENRVKFGTHAGRRIPIRIQLSVAITLVVVFTIVILSTLFLNRQRQNLYQQTVKSGKISLNYFVNNAKEPLLNDETLKLNMLIKEASNVEGLLYASIIGRDDTIKAHTDHSKIGKPFETFSPLTPTTKEADLEYFTYVVAGGSSILNLSRPVMFQDKKLGSIQVGISIDFINQQIKRERLYILIISFAIIIVGIAVAILLGIGFSKPLSELVHATQEIGKGNFQHKTGHIRNDEFGDLAASFNYMCSELSMKSWMQETFGRYVSPEILEMIIAHPGEAWLKGTRSEASILFTDIRGFTAFSEGTEPEKVVEHLNEYFSIATKHILENGGYVDKFIGDAVLGVFGVPVAKADHAERAVRAAFNMQKELIETSSKNSNPLLSKIGIGINSGIVVSGNLGSQVKMEYTVIGDSVNVASRLNGLAGAGETIVSKSVYDLTNKIAEMKALPLKTIKGKADPVETFIVMDIR